jgi:hypothetical protein
VEESSLQEVRGLQSENLAVKEKRQVLVKQVVRLEMETN